MKKTLRTIGIWIAAQLVITFLFMIVATIQGNDIMSVLAPSLLVSDGIVIIALLIMKYCTLKEMFKPAPGMVLLISMVFGMSGMMAVDILSSGFDIPNTLADQFDAMSKTMTGFLAICIIGPIMEEMMMRRVILREIKMKTKSMWAGILISSAIFAIIHINPIQVVFAMPAGIILGWLYCKTGTLLIPICLHILNNTISFMAMRAGSDGGDDEFTIKTTAGVVTFMVLAIVFVITAIWIVRYYAKLKKQQEEEAQSAAELAAEPAESTSKGTFQGDNYEK